MTESNPAEAEGLGASVLARARHLHARVNALVAAVDDAEMAASVQTGCAARRDGSAPPKA